MEDRFRKSPIPSFLLLVFVIYFLPEILSIINEYSSLTYTVIYDIMAFISALYVIYVLDRNDLFKMKKGLVGYISIIALIIFCLCSLEKSQFFDMLYLYLRMVCYYLIPLHILLFVLQDMKDKEDKLIVEEIKSRTKLEKKKIKK